MKKKIKLAITKNICFFFFFSFFFSCHLIDGVVLVKVMKFEHSNKKRTNFITIKGTELLKNQQRVG